MKFLYFVLTIVLAVAGCSKTPAGEKPLVIGMELNYPPFEMKTPDGTPSGVSVEMAHALGDYLHREVKIEDMRFDALIPSLQTGKIDLIISSLTKTEQRAKTIDFSDPYLSTGISILAGKNSNVNSIEDLDQAGRVVAVKKGTTGHTYAVNHLQKAKVLTFDQDGTAVLEVVQGKADAFLYDQMSIFQHYRRNKETTKAILAPFQKESWAMGIRKGNDQLTAEVNKFIADFKKKKGFEKLGDKYLGEDKKAFAEMGYPFYF